MTKKKVSRSDINFMGQIISVMTRRMFGLADAVDKREDSKELVTEYLADIALSVSILTSYYDIEYTAINKQVEFLTQKSKEELAQYLSDILNGTDEYEIESAISGTSSKESLEEVVSPEVVSPEAVK
jgi:MinD-like ATPase involved in chromosome partitioning or flagellar assembly